MDAIGFKESNLVLVPGECPNTDQLAVAVCVIPEEPALEGMHFVVSCWKLEEGDLNKIKETGVIWVSLMGLPAPPIMLTTQNPITELGYVPVELKYN